MLQFAVANLQAFDQTFEIPCSVGKWEFDRAHNYDELIPKLERGMCGNTYYASNMAITLNSTDAEFGAAVDEIIDACMMLSFLNARCVTPTGTTAQSTPQFLQLSDDFIPARSILGFDEINPPSLTALFSNWLTLRSSAYQQRRMRLHLSHWLSGLTCFSLEDLYLAAGVQMDIVKQIERVLSGNYGLTYFQGMTSASNRFGLTPLGSDYKSMRNDIVHEGVLSGANFAGKTKADCADVIANTMNWIDDYLLTALGWKGGVTNVPRWKGRVLQHSLPSISVR